MHYKLIFIILLITSSYTQSLFNRVIGTNPTSGSSVSTAIGNTFLLNSFGSSNVRYNPAKLSQLDSTLLFDYELNSTSIFERRSIPIKDSFGDFLTNADYVSNEFIYYSYKMGFIYSTNLSSLGTIGIGFYRAPLTHFIYEYSEEIRGSYKLSDDEYASKDPIVGYHNLKNEGTAMINSSGFGMTFNLGKINFSFGGSINLIQPSLISDYIEVDTLYSDVTNLSTLQDLKSDYNTLNSNFINFSSTINYNSIIELGLLFEEYATVKSESDEFNYKIDMNSNLINFFDNNNYVISGVNYSKPQIISIALTYKKNTAQAISINFQYDQISYKSNFNLLNLNNYNRYKFGFEYLSYQKIPIRAGLIYKEPLLQGLESTSIFTFGTGRYLGNIILDLSGTYSLQSYKYPDLFSIDNDVRPVYDLVRDSQLNLQIGITYKI